ncbi:glycosyltransferase family 39 protein [Gimesia sp.]|uniref:glycosyltransferase family 39 protein n=1 Tax=Gimesia sp. TaxID=2024833 RepID=UPI0032F06F45
MKFASSPAPDCFQINQCSTEIDQVAWKCFLLLIVMLGAWGRVYGLGDLSLWFDECFCWKMSTYPLSEQWKRAAGDNHPPLFYFFLKAWTMLVGHSPAGVRLLSVLSGIATISGTFFLVRKIEIDVLKCSPNDARAIQPALFATLLVALSPFQIEWSQTVRMYALGGAFSVWSTWALLQALNSSRPHVRDWLLYGLLAAGLIYTHYFGFFILAAHGIYGGIRILNTLRRDSCDPAEKKQLLKYALLASVVVAVLWFPWLDEFLLQRQRGLEQKWGRPQGIDHFTRSVSEMFGLMWNPTSAELLRSRIVTILFSVLAIVTLLLGRKSERLLALIVFLSFGLALLLGSGSKSLIASWYFLFAHVFFLCALTILLFRIPSRWLSRCVLGAVLIGAGWQFTQQLIWRASRIELPSFQAAVHYVEALRESDELIFVNGPRDYVAVSPYLHDCQPVYVVADEWDFVFGTGTAVVEREKHLTPGDVSVLDQSRAWVIFATNKSMNPPGVIMPEDWIDVTEERFNDWRYGQIVVRQYEHLPEFSQMSDKKTEL